MDPNATYNQLLTALGQSRFTDAKRHYKQLVGWLNKDGFEPHWDEMPGRWSITQQPVDCFEVAAGQQVGKRMITVYSYRNDSFFITASGTSHRSALGRMICDMEALSESSTDSGSRSAAVE